MTALEIFRDRLCDALDDARRVYEADRATGSTSTAFQSGRYDGLKQALGILDGLVDTGV